MTRIIRTLIRADGTEQPLDGPASMDKIAELIGADALDQVLLRSWGRPIHVMLVDDNGHAKGLPRNDKATSLYLEQCVPGTQHWIAGDAVIVPDWDFEGM